MAKELSAGDTGQFNFRIDTIDHLERRLPYSHVCDTCRFRRVIKEIPVTFSCECGVTYFLNSRHRR